MNNENSIMKYLVYILSAIIIGGSLIVCCVVGVKGLADYKQRKYEVKVTGSAKKQIVSDLVIWTGYYNNYSTDMKAGYAKLEADKEKVSKYLISKGVNESEIVFSSVSVSEDYTYETDEVTGKSKKIINGYNMQQSVSIKSNQVDLITEISRTATELINQDIQFQSRQPEYQYTKLEDLKLEMLAEASKDAYNRAVIMAENAGSGIGALTSSKLSSINITPLYNVDNMNSDGYYWYADNDTVSIEKEITLTVTCSFEAK